MKVPNPGIKNPEYPLHKASFYLEDVKWGRPAWDAPTADLKPQGGDAAEADREMAVLLHDADVDLDAVELRDACEHYAESYAVQMGVPILVARTLFRDGLMHGIAMMAGLKGMTPGVYR